jgi:proline iminopeptidase
MSYRELFPEIEPYDSGFLQVSDLHHIFYEQSGNKDGKPVIYVHGGPGGGTGPRDRRYFDPAVYRIILLDQRGAGRSRPSAELKENTTWHLIADLERLRCHLGIDNWVVFGGSWGSTLALIYAEQHPDRVKALILRGIFTLRRRELEWYYQDGANRIFPDAWEKFIEPIPLVERHDLMSAYHRRLTGHDESIQLMCAQRWSAWEMSTSRLLVDHELLKRAETDSWALQFAKIEAHYFVNGGFFRNDMHIFEDIEKIQHIPATIIQGRYDIVCPAETAWHLHKCWPEAELCIVDDAGHSAKEPGITTQLLNATDKYKTL